MRCLNQKINLYLFGVTLFLLFCMVPTTTHAAISIEPIYSVLKHTDVGTGAQIKDIWTKLMNYINFLIIGVLIFVAFAQILQLNINTYGIKKILPAIILAIIASNFSFLFCRLMVDLSNIIISLFIEKQVDHTTLSANFSGSWADPANWDPPLKDAATTAGDILWFLVAQLFVIAGAIVTLILAYLFFVRIWMVYFLVALAPLAIMSTVLPSTKSLFSQWMSNIAKWIFMPIVSVFWIWLGNQWLGSVRGDFMMSYVFAGICYYLAITTPFKMGGAIMSAWSNIGKKAYNNWATNKAKEKWIDPLVDDTKRRIGNWYQSQGNKHNPLGTLVRRSHRVGAMREWRKKEEEGYLNQNRREAFGGKFGKDHDGTEFMSLKKQEKWGEWLDNIDSLFGEQEWKELDLREKYFRTDKGKEAAKRTAQYGYRMEGTEAEIEEVKRGARIKALGRDEEYMKDPHYAAMVDRRNKAKGRAFALEMEEKKIEGDLFQTVEGQAYLSDMDVEAYHEWKEKVEQAKGNLEKATTRKEKKMAKAQLEEAEKYLKRAVDSYSERSVKLLNNDKYFDKKTKKFKGLSYMFKDIYTDKDGNLQGVQFDAQGNITGADVSKARQLAEVMGFQRGTTSWNYYNGRRTKRYGIIVKEELASVKNKRTGEDSIPEILNHDYELAALPKLLAGLTGGLTEEQLRKTPAELANMFTALSANNAQWVPRHILLASWEAKYAGDITEEANAIRAKMAQKSIAALDRFANAATEITMINRKLNTKFAEEIKAEVEKENERRASAKEDLLDETEKEKLTNEFLAKNKEAQEEKTKLMKQRIAENYSIIGSEVEDLFNSDAVKFEYNKENGRIDVKIDDSASDKITAEQKTELLHVLNNAIINGNTRGTEGEAKNSYNGKNDELMDFIKREMGKNQEIFLGYDQSKNIMKTAAQKAAEEWDKEIARRMDEGGRTREEAEREMESEEEEEDDENET